MTLIAIIIGLLVERFLAPVQDLRQFGWFTGFSAWLRGLRQEGGAWDGPVGVLLAVGLPVLVLAAMQSFLGDHFLGFLFGVAVLLLCLGPDDLDRQVEAFVTAAEGEDEEEKQRTAAALIDADLAADEAGRCRQGTVRVLTEANRRIFAVLFWFAVLGPLGAGLYRLTAVLEEAERGREGVGEAAARLLALLDWIPAHLAVMGYALSGHFEAAVRAWREREDQAFPAPAAPLLVAIGLGALDHADAAIDPETPAEEVWTPELVRSAMGLVWRTLIVWVTVLALLTLAGWAG